MSTTADELREEVRARYAESARAVTEGRSGDCGCGSGSCCADAESDASLFGVDRDGVRRRHDRRDARARPQERGRRRCRQRALPQGRDRADPPPGGVGRRRDLELRDQPLGRQAGRADGDRPRGEPGGRIGISDVVAEDRLSPDERAERGSYVGCIAGALSKGEYEARLEAAGFEEVSVEFTHQVADGMHGAIVKAVKTHEPAARGLPVIQPATSSGCC